MTRIRKQCQNEFELFGNVACLLGPHECRSAILKITILKAGRDRCARSGRNDQPL